MLALSSLVLPAMLFPAPAAHASHWAFDASGSKYAPTVMGNASPALPTWSPPAQPTVNRMAFPRTTVTAKDTQGTSNPSCTASATLTLTIKVTWVHDTTAQTDTTDPAPTSVWLVENGSAAWAGSINVAPPTGGGGPAAVQKPRGMLRPAADPAPACTISGQKADDGLNDPEKDTSGPSSSSGSSMTPTAQPGAQPPPPGWSVQKVTGGTFTLTRTLLAKVTAAGNVPYTATASSTLSYSVSIHAQPYNFTQAIPTTGNDGTGHSNGVYITKYTWSSTDGSLSDLSSCTEYEFVTYPGTQGTATSPTAYLPPNPPFNSSWDYDTSVPPQPRFPNPTQNGGNASAGFSTDTIAIYGFSPPYTMGGGFTGTQNFYFDDSQTGDMMVPMPGNVPMPISIVRKVGNFDPNSPNYWYYTVTKTSPSSNPTIKYPLPGQ